MVRGFWGDIVQSPYVPFGVELWKEPEKTMFKKQINFQQVYVSDKNFLLTFKILVLTEISLNFSPPEISPNSMCRTTSQSLKI